MHFESDFGNYCGGLSGFCAARAAGQNLRKTRKTGSIVLGLLSLTRPQPETMSKNQIEPKFFFQKLVLEFFCFYRARFLLKVFSQSLDAEFSLIYSFQKFFELAKWCFWILCQAVFLFIRAPNKWELLNLLSRSTNLARHCPTAGQPGPRRA